MVYSYLILKNGTAVLETGRGASGAGRGGGTASHAAQSGQSRNPCAPLWTKLSTEQQEQWLRDYPEAAMAARKEANKVV